MFNKVKITVTANRSSELLTFVETPGQEKFDSRLGSHLSCSCVSILAFSIVIQTHWTIYATGLISSH